MNNKIEKELVSLHEICEEMRSVIDEKTGKIIKKPVHFSSMKAMLRGASQFVEFFEQMHRDGKVYGSDIPDIFRFSLKTGEMTCTDRRAGNITSDNVKTVGESGSNMKTGNVFRDSTEIGNISSDCDNITTTDANYSIQENVQIAISEFLAPELVEVIRDQNIQGNIRIQDTQEQDVQESIRIQDIQEQNLPFTVETDRYFMAVFLFEYFFHTGSPFEGKRMVNRCFLSPLEKEIFRTEQGQFCMDIGENDNTPVKGIQDKLIHYWQEYPDILRKMFQRAFMDGGTLCELRPTEVDWKQVLVQMAMDYKVCGCGFQGFSDQLLPKENGTFACPKCGKIYYALTNGMDRILLADGVKLYECQTGKDPFNKDKVTALVVENRQKKGLYGIKNVSTGVWKGMFPDGSVKEIGEGQGIPIWNGMMVRFEAGEEWSLRLRYQTEEKEVDESEQQIYGTEY